MFRRREFLGGGAALAVAAVEKLHEHSVSSVNPLNYGARGDGITDDTAAVRRTFNAALAKAARVEGGDALFAVDGNIEIFGAVSPEIRSLRLKQLSPAADRKTLRFVGCQGIRIDKLQIDVGASAGTGYFNDSGGLWIDGGSDHDVRNVKVFGNGKNSLVAIWNTRRSRYSNLFVCGARYEDPAARDDVLQGIFMVKNSDCTLNSPVVCNLSGDAVPRLPTRYTRGIVLGGNLRVNILGAKVTNVDQGIDLTGSDGNLSCLVLRSHTLQCSSVGIKLANSAERCRVVESVAERCGLAGFLASGPSESGLPHRSRDCDFVRCTALDIGYNGFRDSAPHAGFRVERGRADPTFPMGIRFIGCRAIDRQSIRTMEYGFYEHVEADPAVSTPNRLIDCQSEGYIRGAKMGAWH